MRIPHLSRTIVDDSPSETIEVNIPSDPHLDDPGLFEDKKEYARWMERMKKMIRDSTEYQDLILFQKHRRGLDRCGIHQHLTIHNGFRIEAHHTPFTLADIVHVIVNKRLNRGESTRMTEIADEVMEIHYLELVGLYPLCQLCHKAIHSDSLGDKFFIPMADVRGDPERFVEIYGEHMPEVMAMKWENIRVLNKSYDLVEKNVPPEIRKKYLYVKPSERYNGSVISTRKLIDFINKAE